MKRLGILLLALVLPPALYFPTIGSELARRQRSAEDVIREMDKDIEQARAAERKLPQFRAEVARLDEENAKLRRIVPTGIVLSDLLTTVRTMAAARGVLLTRFEPREIQREGVVQEQPVVMQVVGDAQSTSGFLQDLQYASRIMNTTYVTLRKDPAGWRSDFVLTTWAMPDR